MCVCVSLTHDDRENVKLRVAIDISIVEFPYMY